MVDDMVKGFWEIECAGCSIKISVHGYDSEHFESFGGVGILVEIEHGNGLGRAGCWPGGDGH